MLHPVFSTLIKRPDLLADHVSAYVELIHQEASGASAEWFKRGLAWAMAAFGGLLFLMFSGVALMLGVLHGFHWVLLAVPGVVLLLTLMAIARARSSLPTSGFTELKAQLDSDVRALREAAQ